LRKVSSSMNHGAINDINVMSQLTVTDVVKSFPTRAESLVVLRGVSFELASGENLAVLGPSGCGKSTLLHILGTLDTPTTGRVALDGVDPTNLGEPALAAFRNQRVGFVFQDHHLLPQCSVLENVLVPTLADGGPKPATVERARLLLDRVGLSARLEHRPAELSGGERQRTAIARSLINAPALLLADVAQLLLELQAAENTMLVVVTHSGELAAHMQRRVTLDDGRLVPLA
jgi:lipoprotein-releasing system ATP-binding protein